MVSTTAARWMVWRSRWGGGSSVVGERKTEAAMPRSSELYHASLRRALFCGCCESSFGLVPLHRNLWILRLWSCCLGGNIKVLPWILLIEVKAVNAMARESKWQLLVSSTYDFFKYLRFRLMIATQKKTRQSKLFSSFFWFWDHHSCIVKC